MRRAALVALLLVVLAILAAPFFAFGPNGGPLLTPGHLLEPRLAVERVRERLSARETVVYKWRDASGAWVYGEQPPAGVEAEAFTVHSQTNLLPAAPTRED